MRVTTKTQGVRCGYSRVIGAHDAVCYKHRANTASSMFQDYYSFLELSRVSVEYTLPHFYERIKLFLLL